MIIHPTSYAPIRFIDRDRGRDMIFGKEDTVQMIEMALNQCSAEAYDSICKIIYADAKVLIFKYFSGLCQADQEDVLQDVVVKVIQRLPQFYHEAGKYSEAERDSWLRSIVLNQCRDLIRKQNRMHLNDSAEYNDALNTPDNRDIESDIANRDLLLQSLKRIYSLHTSAETLIAFTYNRLLGTLASKNGSPRDIQDELYMKPLCEICKRIEKELSNVLNYQIPHHVMQPLWEKVNDNPTKPFTLSERTISDRSSWVAKKAKEQYKNEK